MVNFLRLRKHLHIQIHVCNAASRIPEREGNRSCVINDHARHPLSSYGNKKAAGALQRSCVACVKSKKRDGAQHPQNGLSNRKFQPNSRAATSQDPFQRTIKFCWKTSDSLQKCTQNVQIELFGLIGIIMGARTSRKPPKWVQM